MICPQGIRAGEATYTTAAPSRIRGDIDAAVASVRQMLGPYVADGPLVYVGFSLGAMNGIEVVSKAGALFLPA